jgi:hypothetical protein
VVLMKMEWLCRAATICTAAVLFAGQVQAQAFGQSPIEGRLIAQTPAYPTDPKMQALQAASDSKDATAILNLLDQTPRNERVPMAGLLLPPAQNSTVSDKQFAASLAALAFASGGLTGAQQNSAIAVIRNAPSGPAIVAICRRIAGQGAAAFPMCLRSPWLTWS